MIGYLSDSTKFGSIKPTDLFDEQTILSVYTFPNTFGIFLKAKSTIILQLNFFDHIKVQGENDKIYTLYAKDALFSPSKCHEKFASTRRLICVDLAFQIKSPISKPN